MSELLDATKMVTVLVPQPCARCGRTIAPGTDGVLVESSVAHGECFRRYVCPACQARATGGKHDGRG